METEATYHSIWDNGEIDVESEILVNLDTMKIIGWGERKSNSCDIDDELENLEEEYVEFSDGTRYTAMSEDEYDFGLANPNDYDDYGNGIITY